MSPLAYTVKATPEQKQLLKRAGFGGCVVCDEFPQYIITWEGQKWWHFDEPENRDPAYKPAFERWLKETEGEPRIVVHGVIERAHEWGMVIKEPVTALYSYPVKDGEWAWPAKLLLKLWKARKYIPADVMPVIQGFGGQKWRLPRPWEMKLQKAIWQFVFGKRIWRFAYFAWEGFGFDGMKQHENLWPSGNGKE